MYFLKLQEWNQTSQTRQFAYILEEALGIIYTVNGILSQNADIWLIRKIKYILFFYYSATASLLYLEYTIKSIFSTYHSWNTEMDAFLCTINPALLFSFLLNTLPLPCIGNAIQDFGEACTFCAIIFFLWVLDSSLKKFLSSFRARYSLSMPSDFASLTSNSLLPFCVWIYPHPFYLLKIFHVSACLIPYKGQTE